MSYNKVLNICDYCSDSLLMGNAAIKACISSNRFQLWLASYNSIIPKGWMVHKKLITLRNLFPVWNIMFRKIMKKALFKVSMSWQNSRDDLPWNNMWVNCPLAICFFIINTCMEWISSIKKLELIALIGVR